MKGEYDIYTMLISIHAPREGSDGMVVFNEVHQFEFLSTLPARGATRVGQGVLSISDGFLSTLPARGATANVLKNKRLSSAAFV